MKYENKKLPGIVLELDESMSFDQLGKYENTAMDYFKKAKEKDGSNFTDFDLWTGAITAMKAAKFYTLEGADIDKLSAREATWIARTVSKFIRDEIKTLDPN